MNIQYRGNEGREQLQFLVVGTVLINFQCKEIHKGTMDK